MRHLLRRNILLVNGAILAHASLSHDLRQEFANSILEEAE
jgi:hypothetical protein